MGKHVLFKTGIRRLGSKERGFFYRYPGTDETVREERVLRRIENLKVPPAWEDARIARSPSAKAQAIGYDSAGRLQYLYHPELGGAQRAREVRAHPALLRRPSRDAPHYKQSPAAQAPRPREGPGDHDAADERY